MLISGRKPADRIGLRPTSRPRRRLVRTAIKMTSRRPLYKPLILNGGEGGIRTTLWDLESVSYRLVVARFAQIAIDAADHCTLLHAGPRRHRESETGLRSRGRTSSLAPYWRDRVLHTARSASTAATSLWRRVSNASNSFSSRQRWALFSNHAAASGNRSKRR